MGKETTLQELDFDLSSEEIELLEDASKDVVCEGGSEGWSG